MNTKLKSNFILPYLVLFCFLFLVTNLATAAGATLGTGGAGALGNLDIQQILTNLTAIIGPLTTLILIVSFVSGVFFIFKGITALHTFGQMQQQKQGAISPLIHIMIGAVLLYIPTTANIFSTSIFGSTINSIFNNNSVTVQSDNGDSYTINVGANYDTNASSELMQYVSVGGGQDWSGLINTIVQFIQLIGLIAFIRGWFILTQIGHSGAQQGVFGKGLIHIIGGIIAINFVPAVQALASIMFHP